MIYGPASSHRRDRLSALAVASGMACWAGINAGPWYLEQLPDDLAGWANALRALAPLAPLVVWPFLTRHRLPTLAESFWILYCGWSLVAAVVGGAEVDIWYWAFAYLGVFAAIDAVIGKDDSLTRAMMLNRLSWVLATLLLVIMALVARDVLLVETKFGLSAHGLVKRTDLGAFGPISRSTGMARLATVPAVCALVFAMATHGIRRLVWSGVVAASLAAIWLLQARQGLVTVLALAFVVALYNAKSRLVGIGAMVLVVLVLLWDLIPQSWGDYLYNFATRGEGLSKLQGMSGRDYIWNRGWRLVEDAPWLGSGPQADRVVLEFNAQNGFLYAALAAGYPGALLYAAGIVWGWVWFARALFLGYARDTRERLFFIQAGGIMLYLTIRNIPENTAALYSVDLLLHAPILAYLGTLNRLHRPVRRQARDADSPPAFLPDRRIPSPGGAATQGAGRHR